jgi:hypothetical protein
MSEAETRKKIAELESQINAHKQAIQEHYQAISALDVKIESLQHQRDELQTSLAPSKDYADYYDAIISFLSSAEHCWNVNIDNETPTRQIMTDIHCGRTKTEKGEVSIDYALLNCQIVLISKTQLFHINCPFYRIEPAGIFTATEYKGNSNGVFHIATSSNKTVLLKNGKTAHLFSKPFILRAQTNDSSYGKTSDFYCVAYVW